MKNRLLKVLMVGVLLTLSSWGYKGHQTIAYIAQKHLTPQAAMAVKQLLGNKSLEDIASWADEVDRQPRWKYTAPWHYVNVTADLNKQQFESAVKASPNGNLLKGLTQCETELSNPEVSIAQKAIDLKFIVHLAGDAHQPMHVSRADDKGGNKIQVRFDGRGTNLHALWDSRLLDKQALTDAQFAAKFDRQSAAQIALWQGNGPLEWMYESYLLSARLYRETANNHNLNDAYYNQHIALANKRLEIAGIRLAGLLNRLFKNGLQMTASVKRQVNTASGNRLIKTVDAGDIANHYNEAISVTTKIFGYKKVKGMTLVDAGGQYPNQLFTIVLKGDAQTFSGRMAGKTIRVNGTAINYKGKPEIVIIHPADMIIK